MGSETLEVNPPCGIQKWSYRSALGGTDAGSVSSIRTEEPDLTVSTAGNQQVDHLHGSSGCHQGIALLFGRLVDRWFQVSCHDDT